MISNNVVYKVQQFVSSVGDIANHGRYFEPVKIISIFVRLGSNTTK